jgi:hypothetical protein
VLLGHFHNFAQVAPNAFYPGATETFAFGDLPKGEEPKVKGIAVMDTASGTVRHHPVPGGRALLTFAVDAFDRSPDEVYRLAAEQAAGQDATGAVVRVFVNQARPEIRRLLDRRALAEAFPGALHVQVQIEALGEDGAAQLAPEPVASLAGEWDRYLGSVPIEGYDRERLAALGRDFLERAEEEAG